MLMVFRVYGALYKRQKKPTLVPQFTPSQHGLAVSLMPVHYESGSMIVPQGIIIKTQEVTPP
jgi:hypothetical protein